VRFFSIFFRVLGLLLAILGGAGAGAHIALRPLTAVVFLAFFALPGVLLVALAPEDRSE